MQNKKSDSLKRPSLVHMNCVSWMLKDDPQFKWMKITKWPKSWFFDLSGLRLNQAMAFVSWIRWTKICTQRNACYHEGTECVFWSKNFDRICIFAYHKTKLSSIQFWCFCFPWSVQLTVWSPESSTSQLANRFSKLIHENPLLHRASYIVKDSPQVFKLLGTYWRLKNYYNFLVLEFWKWPMQYFPFSALKNVWLRSPVTHDRCDTVDKLQTAVILIITDAL